MRQISGHSGCVDNVEQAQVGDQGALLQQKGQGLSNAAGSSANSHTSIVLWVGKGRVSDWRDEKSDYVNDYLFPTWELVEKLLADLSTAPQAARLNMVIGVNFVVKREKLLTNLSGLPDNWVPETFANFCSDLFYRVSNLKCPYTWAPNTCLFEIAYNLLFLKF